MLQTLMKLYSDAIEYYGAQDDNEMCIDLNMRMQSVLVRPYILDALQDHENLDRQQKQEMYEELVDAESGEMKTNFERDKRRETNPFRANNRLSDITEESPSLASKKTS